MRQSECSLLVLPVRRDETPGVEVEVQNGTDVGNLVFDQLQQRPRLSDHCFSEVRNENEPRLAVPSCHGRR